MTTIPLKPRVSLGRALLRTQVDVDRLSVVTPADVAAAVRLWDETTPLEWRGLMHATTREGQRT